MAKGAASQPDLVTDEFWETAQEEPCLDWAQTTEPGAGNNWDNTCKEKVQQAPVAQLSDSPEWQAFLRDLGQVPTSEQPSTAPCSNHQINTVSNELCITLRHVAEPTHTPAPATLFAQPISGAEYPPSDVFRQPNCTMVWSSRTVTSGATVPYAAAATPPTPYHIHIHHHQYPTPVVQTAPPCLGIRTAERTVPCESTNSLQHTVPHSPAGQLGRSVTPEADVSSTTMVRGLAMDSLTSVDSPSSDMGDDQHQDSEALTRLPRGASYRVALRLALADMGLRMPSMPPGFNEKAETLAWLEQLWGPYLTPEVMKLLCKKNKACEVVQALVRAYTKDRVRLSAHQVCQLFEGRGKSLTGRFVGYQRSAALRALIRRQGVELPLLAGVQWCRARAAALKAQAKAAGR